MKIKLKVNKKIFSVDVDPDTPLIFVVGLSEVVGMLQMAKTNPKWLGYAMEGYIFASILFWAICYAMSKYSQYLELKYKTDR